MEVDRIWRADRRLLDLHLWFALNIFFLFDGDVARLGIVRRLQNTSRGSVNDARL